MVGLHKIIFYTDKLSNDSNVLASALLTMTQQTGVYAKTKKLGILTKLIFSLFFDKFWNVCQGYIVLMEYTTTFILLESINERILIIDLNI